MVEIVEVKTRKQLKDFIMFPFKLYKDNPYWVPPLIMDEFNTLNRKKIPLLNIVMPNTGLPIKRETCREDCRNTESCLCSKMGK